MGDSQSSQKHSFFKNVKLDDDSSNDSTHEVLSNSSIQKDIINGSSEDNGQQPQQNPFQIILVDIKKTAEEEEICCVKKPLMGNEDLKFVALSYRTGILEETVVDTQVGYLTNVTLFDLKDFYNLCQMMAKEQDLKHMDYVWVDNICVDQSSYELRKATIFQKTSIYERANYVIAVPDLHLSYLMDTNTKANEVIRGTVENSRYIYHLIHENTDQLVKINEQWLDDIGVPKESALRQMLATYTDNLTNYKVQDSIVNDDSLYCSLNSVVSMNNSIKSSACEKYTTHARHSLQTTAEFKSYQRSENNQTNLRIKQLEENIPLHYDRQRHIRELKNSEWKQQIALRTESIRQSMDFLTDLIKDWSCRVWAINEYSIAKKKKSHIMKYWFIQLQGLLELDGFCFFEFNFDHLSSSSSSGQQDNCIFKAGSSHHVLTTRSAFIYQTFRKTMLRQLNQQTFLEMMLKSKTRKNVDRFYAILPLSEYGYLNISPQMVDGWDIRSMISVKLKLYELMNTKDKLELLFLSSKPSSKFMVLPTFATSRIEWPTADEYAMQGGEGGGAHFPCNFDLASQATIMLMPTKPLNTITGVNDEYHKLNIKPCEYYSCDNSIFAEKIIENNETVCKRLALGDDPDERFDMVSIPSYGGSDIKSHGRRHRSDFRCRKLFLVGSFAKNKWMITAALVFTSTDVLPNWTLHYTNDNIGFDIF